MFYIYYKVKSKLNFYVASISAIVNLLLNFLFIPEFGMYGAAIATLLSILTLNFVQYQKSKSCYFIPLPWVNYITTILLSLITVSVINWFIQTVGLLSFSVKIALVILLGLYLTKSIIGYSKVLNCSK
nr:polysaccharide biosynthesis C-terminal domain-containing protein [Vibrio taketomensis]